MYYNDLNFTLSNAQCTLRTFTRSGFIVNFLYVKSISLIKPSEKEIKYSFNSETEGIRIRTFGKNCCAFNLTLLQWPVYVQKYRDSDQLDSPKNAPIDNFYEDCHIALKPT